MQRESRHADDTGIRHDPRRDRRATADIDRGRGIPPDWDAATLNGALYQQGILSPVPLARRPRYRQGPGICSRGQRGAQLDRYLRSSPVRAHPAPDPLSRPESIEHVWAIIKRRLLAPQRAGLELNNAEDLGGDTGRVGRRAHETIDRLAHTPRSCPRRQGMACTLLGIDSLHARAPLLAILAL